MRQPVNGFCQGVAESPGQRVLQAAKVAPVSHEMVKKGAWDVTVTKRQVDGPSWSVTWVEDDGSESCDDVEL